MSDKRLYEVNGFTLSQEQYERYLERINAENDVSYIVSKIKEQIQGHDVYVPYIQRHMVWPIIEEMLCDKDEIFTDRHMYDFICEYWDWVEDGNHYAKMADVLSELRYGYEESVIDKQLKKRLVKQIDKDGYITIYRGYNSTSRENGNSYTLSRDVAIWFANRFKTNVRYVNTYRIHIDNVLAFITKRKEAEIVALPEDVILLETINY